MPDRIGVSNDADDEHDADSRTSGSSVPRTATPPAEVSEKDSKPEPQKQPDELVQEPLRVVPEDSLVWEIHLRPKPSTSPEEVE